MVAGAGGGPGAAGMAKGVDSGRGVALGEGVIDGVLEGDCVDGVVDRGEVGGGVCARRNPAPHENAASADSRRTPAFDAFHIDSFEMHGVYGVYLNVRLKSH